MRLKWLLWSLLLPSIVFAAKPDKPVHKVKVSKLEWWTLKSDKLAEKHFGVVPGKRAWLADNIGLMQKWGVVVKELDDDVEIEYPTRVVDLPNTEYLLPNGKVDWVKVAEKLGLTVLMAKALNPVLE